MPAEPQNVRPQPQGQNIKPKEALDILQNAGWQPVTDRDGNARLYADTSQMTPKQLDDLQKAAKIANLPFEIKESGLGKQVFSVSTNNYYTQTEALEKTTKGILGGLKQSFDNVKGALFAPSPSPAPEPQEIPKAKPFDPSVQTEKQTQIAQDISRRLGTSPDQIRFHRDGSIGVIVDAGYSRSEFANRLDLKVDPGSLSRGAGIDSSTHEIIIAKDQRPARYGFSSDAAPENKTPKASGPAMKPGDVFQTLQTAGWESVTDREGQARLYAETAKMSPYQIAELKEALKTANIPYEIKQSGLRGQVFSVSTADYFNQVPALEAAAKKSGFAGLSDKAEGFLKSIGKKSGIIPAVAIGTVVAGMTFSDGASASDSVKTGAEAVSVTVEVGGKLAEGKKEEAKDAAIIGYSANAASIPAGALALHAARTAGMGVLGMTAATLGGAIVAGILVGSAAEKLIELHNKGNMAHLDGGKLDTAQEVRDMQRTILNDKTHNLPKNITINGEEMSLEQALQHHPKKVAAELEKTHPQAAQAVAQWQELETWRQKFLTNQIPPGTSVPFIRIDDAKDVRGIQDAMLQNPESALPDKFKIAGKEMSMTQALTDHPEKVIEAMKDSPEALAAIGEWKALEEIRMKYQTGQIEAGVEAKLPQQSGTGYTAKAAAPVA